MPWQKSSSELVDAFYAALPDDPRVERRQMFGYPCAFTNGNMFTGLHEQRMVVRLPELQRAELLSKACATPFEPRAGRVMREYVVVPPAMLSRSRDLASWVAEAFRFASTLPAKGAKRRKALQPKDASTSPKRTRRKTK